MQMRVDAGRSQNGWKLIPSGKRCRRDRAESRQGAWGSGVRSHRSGNRRGHAGRRPRPLPGPALRGRGYWSVGTGAWIVAPIRCPPDASFRPGRIFARPPSAATSSSSSPTAAPWKMGQKWVRNGLKLNLRSGIFCYKKKTKKIRFGGKNRTWATVASVGSEMCSSWCWW